MAKQTQAPLVVRAFIALLLVLGCAALLFGCSAVLYRMFTNPEPEPEYIYEPKPVEKYP